MNHSFERFRDQVLASFGICEYSAFHITALLAVNADWSTIVKISTSYVSIQLTKSLIRFQVSIWQILGNSLREDHDWFGNKVKQWTVPY